MGLNERNKIHLPVCNDSTEHYTADQIEDIQNNKVPPIVPCFNGKSLELHEELVGNGLSAISIKHHKGNCNDDKKTKEDDYEIKKNLSNDLETSKEKENANYPKKLSGFCYKHLAKTNGEVPDCLKDQMKRRNSFWNVHQPELSKLTWPENFVFSAALQDFFHDHLSIHGTFCEPLHEFSNRSSIMNEEIRDYSKLREIVSPRSLPPDEKVINIMEKSRSVQLNDEDLDPETMVHKSRAEFCVTIGEYIRRLPLKRTTSQQMAKCVVQQTNRIESLPLQHEGLLSKEIVLSEEKVSAVIGNTDLYLNTAVYKKQPKKSSLEDFSGLLARRESGIGLQLVPPSLSNFHQHYDDQVTEDSGDPARLRTILGPRDETTEESENRQHKV